MQLNNYLLGVSVSGNCCLPVVVGAVVLSQFISRLAIAYRKSRGASPAAPGAAVRASCHSVDDRSARVFLEGWATLEKAELRCTRLGAQRMDLVHRALLPQLILALSALQLSCPLV